MPPERIHSTKFPKEYWKTFTAIMFVLVNFIFTTVSLSITHELRNVSLPPLPDLTLDHLPYRRWALDVSEILIMLATLAAAFLVLFHKYRYSNDTLLSQAHDQGHELEHRFVVCYSSCSRQRADIL